MGKFNYIIRTAEQSDLEELTNLRLKNATYHSNLSQIYKIKKNIKQTLKENTSSMIEGKQSTIFIALENNKIIGYTIGILKGEHPIFEFPKIGFIDDTYINLEYHNKGIGSALIAKLQFWFKENKIDRVDLKVFNLNQNGIKFWKKIGFNCNMLGMTKSIK